MRLGANHVGRIVDGWAVERPDLDPWPIAIWGRVKLLDGLLEQALAGEFAKHRLNGREFELLSALRRMGSPYTASPSELARALLVPAATMTKRLDRLEQAELITRTRDAVDRRGVLITLTTAGLSTTDVLVEVVCAGTKKALRLVADRRDEIDELLRLALRGFEEAQG